MLLFASFLFGCAVFFIRTYFPLAGLLLAASGVIVSGLTAALQTGPASSRFVSAAKKTFVVAVTVAAGFLYAQAFSRPDIPLQEIAGKTISLKGTVRTEPVEVSRRQVLFSQTLGVMEVRDEEGRTFYPEEVRLLHNSPLVPGKTYLIVAQVPGDAFLLNPWTEDPVLTAFAVDVQEVSGSGPGLIGSLRSDINRRMKSDMSHDSAAFLMAMTTGERSFVTSAMRDDFNATGLAHILSISGTHFGLLFCVLFGLLRFSLKLLPAGILVRLTLFLTPTQVAAALAFPFLGAYLALASPSIPAVRSFIMISLFIVGLLVQRRGFWLNTVLFAAVVIVLADPGALRDLSFQLSFIAVLCIGMVTERAREGGKGRQVQNADEQEGPEKMIRPPESIARKALRLTAASSLVSVAATAGTAPLIALTFHAASIVSPLTNLFITPFIGFVLLPLTLLSTLIFIVTGIFPFAAFIDGMTAGVLGLIHQVGQWPFASLRIPHYPLILLIVFYACLFLTIALSVRSNPQGETGTAKGRLQRLSGGAWLIPLCTATVLFMIYAGMKLIEKPSLSVTIVDVGHGDGAVIRLPDGKSVVVDTGRNGLAVAGLLRYAGIGAIDALVISHGQSDHAGGFEYLTRRFRVGEIWDSGRLIYEGYPEGVMHRALQRGDEVRGEGYVITVLHPHERFYSMSRSDEVNNDSLVLRVRGREFSVLFTGDIGREAQEDLIHLGPNLKTDILKVPHHGSRSSFTEEFIHAVSPDLAVISAGRGNRYGHPHEEVLTALTGSQVLRTDRDGAVIVREEPGGGRRIKTAASFAMKRPESPADEWENIKKLFVLW